VKVGAWLQIPAGTQMECEVTAVVSFRSRAVLRSLDFSSLASCPASSVRGDFEPVAAVLPEGSPFQDRAVYLSSATGPLFGALFGVPRARLDLSRIRTPGRLDCLFSWGPVGVAHRPQHADMPPVLLRLRSSGHPALAIPTLAVHGGDGHVLEQVAFLAGLLPELTHNEELFLSRGPRLLRWTPSEPGLSLLDALGPYLLPSSPPATAPPQTEAILEALLSSLWQPGPDDGFYRWMNHPVAVPYDLGAFSCPYLDVLSPAFGARWRLAVACAADESAVDADVGVTITCLAVEGATSRWRVFWHLHHEHVEWEYRVRLDESGLIWGRSLVDQSD